MKNDFKPVVGHRFSLRATTGAAYRLSGPRQSSRTKRCPTRGAALWSRERRDLTLTPTRTGTHLRMEQSGFRPDQQQAYQGAKYGWQKFFANLEQVLARTE